MSLAVKFWGKILSHWLSILFVTLGAGTSVARNRQADEEYQRTIMATIDALKERISLLEKWRQEAKALEDRVAQLEDQIRLLRLAGLAKDDEIFKLSEELRIVKQELRLKENDIRDLVSKLETEKVRGEDLRADLKEALAVQADNELKIGALLHHSSGGQSEKTIKEE